MPLALLLQVLLFKGGSQLVLPLYELTLISGVLTGIYFGVNIVSKTLAPVTNFIPEAEIQKLVDNVQKDEATQTPAYMSKKFFLTAFWCVYMLGLMIVQLLVNGIKLPVMEAVTISAVLTGAYFGTNLLDKIIKPAVTVSPESPPPPAPTP